MPTLSDLSWPKRTDRLSLRLVGDADFEDVWKIRRTGVSQWMTDLSQDWTEFLARISTPEYRAVTLVVERDGAVVGDLMLRVEDAWAQGEVKEQALGTCAEIGWCFDPGVAGQGYATEAAAELLRLAFEDLGLRRVTALCFAANEPSWRLMERIGMRREAHFVKDSLHRELGWMDGFAYGLLAEEWQNRAR